MRAHGGHPHRPWQMDGGSKAGDEQTVNGAFHKKECSCSLSASAGAEVTHYCILIHLYGPFSGRQYLDNKNSL